MNDKLHIGWVDYWNVLPIKLELQRLWGRKIQFTYGVPRQINKKLRDRQLDVALGSSICLATYRGVDMALPVGVACDGEVKSVYLGFVDADARVIDHIKACNASLANLCRARVAANRHDFRDLARFIYRQVELRSYHQPPRIKLSPHSFASNSLVYILYYLWFGASCYDRFASYSAYDSADSADAYVVIGDEALINAGKFAHIIDLGAAWKEITDLPFVYAVAMSTSPLPRLWQQRIRSAADLATSKKLHDPQSYLQQANNQHNLNLCDYWRSTYYHLKERDFCGLYLFLNLYLQLPNIIDSVDPNAMSARAIHWESLANKVRENESPSVS